MTAQCMDHDVRQLVLRVPVTGNPWMSITQASMILPSRTAVKVYTQSDAALTVKCGSAAREQYDLAAR